MAKETNIEWCDATFNPWMGCAKVSPGCANCYAEVSTPVRALRGQGRELWGKGAERKRTQTWGEPIKWNRQAPNDIAWEDHRPRVFCASLSDWLDGEVPIQWLADLLKLIHDTPNLDWLLLTKRPENWSDRLHSVVAHTNEIDVEVSGWLDGYAWGNVWIGTTVEDQKRANERIPKLLEIPAHVRFLSCEPLLESVDLDVAGAWMNCPDGSGGISWVIVGGESGHKKRPFNADWARSIKRDCEIANVAFFMKQIDKVQAIPADLMVRQFPNHSPVTV